MVRISVSPGWTTVMMLLGLGGEGWRVYASTIHNSDFEVLEWLGANSPWFSGPDVFGISTDIPAGCEVDQAAYVIRHGSRYPDLGAYNEWLTFYNKTQSYSFTAKGSLSFLPDWQPVLRYPNDQIAQLSVTGYKELYDLGVTLRFRYPGFYKDNTAFVVWANAFQRTIDSARLFSKGFVGPNSSFVDVVVVNSTHPSAVADSLAPSDGCPNYDDDYSAATDVWDALYLPKITKRLQKLIRGNLNLTDSDVSIFPYLCGYETQITGRRSPWCEVFTSEEIKQYEYRQDLRYWYGTGPGSELEVTMMLPFLKSLTNILTNGPNKTYIGASGKAFTVPPLIVAFTHDNQINQLASVTGVFDDQKALPNDEMLNDRIYISSRVNPMRGTVALERLSCATGKNTEIKEEFIRIRLNDAVYPIVGCQSGHGKSCPLEKYVRIVADKSLKAGNWGKNCGLGNWTEIYGGGTFLTDLKLPWLTIVKP